MYPGGVRQLVEGWTKNLAAGAAGASPVAVAGAVWWVAACCAVAAAGVAAGIEWIAGSGTAPLAPALAWAVVAVQVHWLLGRIGRFRWWTSVVFVVPLAGLRRPCSRCPWSAPCCVGPRPGAGDASTSGVDQ